MLLLPMLYCLGSLVLSCSMDFADTDDNWIIHERMLIYFSVLVYSTILSIRLTTNKNYLQSSNVPVYNAQIKVG